MIDGISHRYYAALILDEEAEYTDIIGTLSEYLADHPSSGAAYNNRALAYYETGQIELARVDFAEAIRLSPNSPIPAMGRANLHRHIGEMIESLADLDLAVLIEPNDAYLRRTRAQARAAAGDLPGALEDLSKAITRDPTFARQYHDRADVDERLGHTVRAKADRLAAFAFGCLS